MEIFVPHLTLEGKMRPFEQDLLRLFPKRKTYRRGEIVYGAPGERGETSYYVLDGTVVCSTVGKGSDPRIWSFHPRGCIFPLFYTFTTITHRSLTQFVANDNVSVLAIPKNRLQEYLESNPDAMMAMIELWSDWCSNLFLLAQFEEMPVRDRMGTLLVLNRDENNCVNLSVSRIASVLDISREHASRIISAFREEGLVQTSPSGITVLNSEKLLPQAMMDSILRTIGYLPNNPDAIRECEVPR